MSADPSNSIVHLTMCFGKTELAIGSGVLYCRNEKLYIVTAWHNVTGRHSETLECLSDQLSVPDRVIAYIACRLGTAGKKASYIRRPFVIPLEDDNATTNYFVHPQTWPQVDVVAIPVDPDAIYDSPYTLSTGEEGIMKASMRSIGKEGSLDSDVECIQDHELSASHLEVCVEADLTVSDELFILGYPKGITDMYCQPIWKRATVATSPQLGWNRQKQFLVDCASREGMSGAPVIYRNKSRSVQRGNTRFMGIPPSSMFCGVYVGRQGKVSDFEAQIGTVWQGVLVDEIIDAEIKAPHSIDLIFTSDNVRSVIESEWPHHVPDYAAEVLGNECFVEGFLYSLMQKLGGRAKPSEVRRMVLSYAQDKLLIS